MAVVKFKLPEMDSFDQLYENYQDSESSLETDGWNPQIDFYETDENYIIIAELPGLKKENIKLTIQDNVLNMSGEKIIPTGVNQRFRSECCYGKFSRSVVISGEFNRSGVIANYIDGVLKIELPKKKKANPREIEII